MYHELINYATPHYPFLTEHLNVRYIPHFHEETELVYGIEGQLDVTLGTQTFTLYANEICIIPQGIVHNLYTNSYSKCFVLKLYPLVDFNNIYLVNYVVSPHTKGYDQLLSNINSIIYENQQKAPGYQLAVNICAENILLTILRELEHHQLDSKVKTKHLSENHFLGTVNAFLEVNYASDLSLGDIAQHFNYTKSYFCRHFKNVTQQSFWDYLTTFRLEKAIQLIKTAPREKFIVIASKAGFKNIRSFNLAFKSYYRCTPSEYRKMLTK